MQKCIEGTISGRNLNYDYLLWINQKANEFGLKGITFFHNDGSLRVIAEGEEEGLDKFIRKLKHGPHFFAFFSPVESFSVTWQEPKNEFKDFSISESGE